MTTTHEIAKLRTSYARTMKLIADSTASGEREYMREEPTRTARKLAHDVASKLGHTPLRQGASVECSRCGDSGAATDKLTGHVFTRWCSEFGAAFAHTCKHCNRKIRALNLDEGGYIDAIDGSANCTYAPNHEVAS